MMLTWFVKKPCEACKSKDAFIASLEAQAMNLRSQLAHSREREEKAVDALLDRQGKPAVTPSPRMTFKDSENVQKQAFGMFLDEDDDGSGNVLEADRLSTERSPLLP
jgi:hypothetical protein